MFVSTLTHSRTVEATFTFLGNKKSSVLTFIWPHNDSCLYNISRLGRPTWKRDIMGISPTQWLCLKFLLLRCKHDIAVSLCVRHEINYAVTFRIQQELLNKTKTSRNRCTRIVWIQAATDANTSQQTRKYTRKVVATYRCEHTGVRPLFVTLLLDFGFASICANCPCVCQDLQHLPCRGAPGCRYSSV